MPRWEEVRTSGIANAARIIAARRDADVLPSLVAAWADTVRARPPTAPENLADLPETVDLAEAFEREGLGTVAEALRLMDQREGAIPPGRWLLARLVGLGEGDCFADGLASDARRPLTLWGLESYGAWEAFVDRLSARLNADAEVREGYWRALDALVEGVRSEPERGALSREREGVRATIDAYRSSPDVKEAWETRLDSYVLMNDELPLAPARRLDPSRYLALLARLPHPVFVAHAVDEKETGDLDRLIRAAPPACDEAGRFAQGGMVLIAVLRACGAACRRCAWGANGAPQPVDEADAASLEPAQAATKAMIETILDALFSRGDAVAVGWLWLERLVFEGERRGIWRVDGRGREGLVLDPLMTLIRGLASRLPPREDPRVWIEDAPDLWRIDRLLAVLAVEGSRASGAPIEAGQTLRELLTALEPAFAGCEEAIQRTDRVVGRVGAAHVLAVPDPAAFMSALWHDLRPARERAWRSLGEQARGNAAELAFLWGICAMEMTRGEPMRRLWYAVRAILEEAMQADEPASPGGYWSAATRRLCRSVPSVLTGDDTHDNELLAELVRPRARADSLLFEMVFTLRSSGVDDRLVEAAVSRWGSGLGTLAERFLALESLRIERGAYSLEWLDRVRALALSQASEAGSMSSGELGSP